MLAGAPPPPPRYGSFALTFTDSSSSSTTTTTATTRSAVSEIHSPIDETLQSRREALAVADPWLTRQQAMQWLSAADEMACLNVDQQKTSSYSPLVASIPLAPDNFGSPAGFSIPSPMSSVPATPIMQGVPPHTDLDSEHVDADHSLEFEIHRDMGMIWRDQALHGREGLPIDCSYPPFGSGSVDPGSPAMFPGDSQHYFPLYPSPDWNSSPFMAPSRSDGGQMPGYPPRSSPYTATAAAVTATHRPPPSLLSSFPAQPPVNAFGDWSGHHLPAHGPRRGHLDTMAYSRHYDSPL